MVSLKKFFKEKRWALFAIIFGTVVGFSSAVLCIAWNLVIFGFNIMYIISPLIAGFIETFIARKRYGKSTGAISALLTFIIINGYGWFSPGWLFPKEPATLSLITIIAIVLTLQAAFPTLVNYILFVVGIGTFRKFIEFLIFLPSKLLRKPPEAKAIGENILPSADEIFLDELTIPLLSVPPVGGKRIKKYVGLVAGEAVTKEKEAVGQISKLTKIIEPTLLDDLYLGEARKLAMSRMLDDANSVGANAVIDVIIDYVSMGGLQGSALIVTTTGTAVITVEGNNNSNEKEFKEYSISNEKINDFEVNEKVSDNKEIISGMDEKNNVYRVLKKISSSNESTSRNDKKINIPKINENVSFNGDRMKVARELIGKEVIDSSAMIVGKIKDIEVNWNNNEIEAIVLGKGGVSEILGLSKEEVIIPYDVVKQIGDRILLKKVNRTKKQDWDFFSYL